MPVEYYLPNTDLNRGSFITQFAAGLLVHATTLGIDPLEVTFVQNAALYFNFLLDTNVAMKKQMNEWVAYKDGFIFKDIGQSVGVLPSVPVITPPAVIINEPIFARITLLVNNIKSRITYNETIGRELGIIGTEIVEPDYNTVKPLISVISTANKVIVKWKKERFSSIDVYIDKGRGTGFVFLDNDSRPPFEMPINLPQGAAPETWIFKAIYKIADQQVGLYSDPVSIVVRSGL